MEKGRISSTQLTTLIIGFVIGEALILQPSREAGREAWIAILLGLGEGLLLGMTYSALADRFRGKTLVEVCHTVYGRYLGGALAVAYIWYLVHLGSEVTAAFGDFWASMAMPRTPMTVTTFILCLICASAVRNGVETVARCGQVLVPIILLAALFDTLLLLGQMDLRNLEPLREIPIRQLLRSAQSAAAFPFGECVAFLMVIPYVTPSEKTSRSVAKGLLVAGLILAATVARNTAVLGATAVLHVYPGYQAVKQIEVGMILTRLEILVAVSLLYMAFLKISLLVYAASLGLGQVFRLRSYRGQVVAVATLMAGLSRHNFTNIVERLEFDKVVYPIYASLFQITIPVITLLLARVRRLPREER